MTPLLNYLLKTIQCRVRASFVVACFLRRILIASSFLPISRQHRGQRVGRRTTRSAQASADTHLTSFGTSRRDNKGCGIGNEGRFAYICRARYVDEIVANKNYSSNHRSSYETRLCACIIYKNTRRAKLAAQQQELSSAAHERGRLQRLHQRRTCV